MANSRRWRRSKAGFGGAWCIPELFAHAFEEAVHGLTGADIAQLKASGDGPVGELGWMDDARLADLEGFISVLRRREPRQRYLLDKSAHRALHDTLGSSPDARARALFVLAKVLDDVFDELHEDVASLPAAMLKRATARPPTFFQDVRNRPPPIGQMTPIAICRGAFLRFWYTGNLAAARMFGPMPAPVRVGLPRRTEAALRDAVDAGELRLTAVCWPPNANPVVGDSSPGRFVVTSNDRATTREELESIVSFAFDAQAHILLLPEIALTPDELRGLAGALARADRRFPVLTVAGLTHHQPDGHPTHVNEAVVLTSNGAELFRHEKLEPFSFGGRFEDIVPRRSSDYHYLDTPIGRLTVNVCRDVRSDVPMILNRVLGAAGVLVPALSNRLDFALEEARLLGARQDAFVLAANPWSEDLRDAACVYIPIQGACGQDQQARSQDMPGSPPAFTYRVTINPDRTASLSAEPARTL